MVFKIGNHIQWIKDKKPGEHYGDLKRNIETFQKSSMHIRNWRDTNTLIAIAEKINF